MEGRKTYHYQNKPAINLIGYQVHVMARILSFSGGAEATTIYGIYPALHQAKIINSNAILKGDFS
jgi:hypothetical protein